MENNNLRKAFQNGVLKPYLRRSGLNVFSVSINIALPPAKFSWSFGIWQVTVKILLYK